MVVMLWFSRLFPMYIVTLAGFAPLVQAADYISEEVFFTDIPQVSSAARMEQKVTEAPVAMTIIDRDMIRDSGAIELAQVFQLVPGFFSYHVLGNQFGVVSRAPSSDYPGALEVMIDGRSVYQPMFSSVEWTSLGLALDDIEYIEVVRGPAASVYGSNAFTGVINIVTRSPVAAPAKSIRGEVGSLDTRNIDVATNISIGEIDSRFNLHYRHNDGFPSNSNLDDSIWPVSKIRDGRETLGLTWSGLYLPGLSHKLSMKMGVVDSEVEFPGADIDGYSTRDHLNSWQQFNWSYMSGDTEEWNLQFYHNRLEFDEMRQLGTLSRLAGIPSELTEVVFGQPDQLLVVDVDDGLSESYDLEFQHNYQQGLWRANWGVGARHQRIRSEYLLGQSGVVDDTAYRGFFNSEWQLNKRLKINLFQVVRFEDGSPLEIEVTHADDLQEAEILSWELAYMWNRPQQGISFELRTYYDDADDGPGTIRVPANDADGQAAQRDQAYDWETTGLEMQLSWQLAPGHRLFAQYAYVDFDGELLRSRDPNRYKEINDALPDHSAGLLYSVELTPWLDFSSFVYYRGDVDWEGGDELDSHTRLDFRLATRLPLMGQVLSVELLAHNVLDDFQDYDENLEFERRLYLRVGMDLD